MADGGLGNVEALGYLSGGHVLIFKKLENPAAGGIGQGFECVVQGRFFLLTFFGKTGTIGLDSFIRKGVGIG